MAQEVRVRKHRTVNYSANTKVTEKLSRGTLLRELYLRLNGTLTVTTANNTAANTEAGDAWASVQRVEVIGNGTDVLFSCTGYELKGINHILYGVGSQYDFANSTDNPTIESTLVVPFWMPRAVRPLDTALDTGKLSDLEIAITWGSHTSINANSTALNARIDVYGLESFGVTGDFATKRQFRIDTNPTATNTDYEIALPVGPMYRGILVRVRKSNEVDNSDHSQVSNLKVVSGSTVFFDMPTKLISQMQHQRLAIPYNTFLARSVDVSEHAWYWLDFATDGRLTECIDTLGFSEFKLVANVASVTGGTFITAIPLQVYPIRKK